MSKHSTPFQVRRICEICGDKFWIHRSDLNVPGRGKYCSQKCYRESRTIPLKDRFAKYCGPKTAAGCIEWTGSKTKDGYGLIGSGGRKGRMLIASRVAWELKYGPIPDGKKVLHECDNPPCVNYKHLFLGTEKDNTDDMLSKGRQRKRVPGSRRYLQELNGPQSREGESNPAARFTERRVLKIRRLYEKRGMTIAAIARRYECGESTISRIINRETWKHI